MDRDRAEPPKRALLVDFGGVLTSDVFEGFRAFAGARGADPKLIERLISENSEVAAALVAHEEGRSSLQDFEQVLAERLSIEGLEVPATGLVKGMTAALRPDHAMMAAVGSARELGHPTAIVSNSLGFEAYDGYDLEALADVVVLSGQVGSRKPSRRIYRYACERLGVKPKGAVMVDDLQQNLVAAARLGIHGVLHTSASETIPELESLLGSDLGGGTAAGRARARHEAAR